VRNEKARVLSILFVVVLLSVEVIAEAQQATKLRRIGILHSGFAGGRTAFDDFRQGLSDLGYRKGKNIVLEYRYAEGKVDQFPNLAVELVRMKVDVIVAGSDAGAQAAKNATETIPIVMVGVGTDPVEMGLVESLARPGGNVTGLTDFGAELGGKRLELLKEALPKVARVAFLYDPANRGNAIQAKEIVPVAARSLGLTIQPWEVRATDDFERVFAGLSKERPDALFLPGGPLMNANHKRVADFALKNRIPSLFPRREVVDGGGLMSYDVDRPTMYRRAAIYVDKILKGAKPADLPVEQPTKFELVINLKTAKQIGLTIPPNVLARADKVIK
jgi:ABC-type uncharacterized transport system substrate-binding protein